MRLSFVLAVVAIFKFTVSRPVRNDCPIWCDVDGYCCPGQKCWHGSVCWSIDPVCSDASHDVIMSWQSGMTIMSAETVQPSSPEESMRLPYGLVRLDRRSNVTYESLKFAT
ncbi:hypothetical protein BDR07DRAFT_930673 [Suillus spraguei]|nr:hypothetical protein BDR07DRAFT_930673 [Suillus spraguei]